MARCGSCLTCLAGCNSCLIVAVQITGWIVVYMIWSQFADGSADLYTDRSDPWCHLFVTTQLLDVSHVLVNTGTLGSFRLGSVSVTGTSLFGWMPSVSSSQRCGVNNAVPGESDEFRRSVYTKSYGGWFLSTGLACWGIIMIVKSCLMKWWVGRVKATSKSSYWNAFVIVTSYGHLVILPTIVLFPLSSMEELSGYPGVLVMNVHWSIWYATLVAAILSLVRWLFYAVLDFKWRKELMLYSTLFTSVILFVACYDLFNNVGWSAVLGIDFAIALQLQFNTGLEVVVSLFQKFLTLNFIIGTLLWLLSGCCGKRGKRDKDSGSNVNRQNVWGQDPGHASFQHPLQGAQSSRKNSGSLMQVQGHQPQFLSKPQGVLSTVATGLSTAFGGAVGEAVGATAPVHGSEPHERGSANTRWWNVSDSLGPSHVVDGGWQQAVGPSMLPPPSGHQPIGQGTSGAVGGYQPGDNLRSQTSRGSPNPSGYQPEGFGPPVGSLMSMHMPVDPVTGKVELPSSLAFGPVTLPRRTHIGVLHGHGDFSSSPHATSERAPLLSVYPGSGFLH